MPTLHHKIDFSYRKFPPVTLRRTVYILLQNEDLSKKISEKGFRDGIRKTFGMSVDNLEYEVHVAKYDKIRQISEDVRFE